MIDLFLSVFLEQKKIQITEKHMKGFSITRGSNIFSIRSDKFWLEDCINTNLKIILKENF